MNAFSCGECAIFLRSSYVIYTHICCSIIRYYALLCNLDASVFVDVFFFQIHPKVLVDPPASCDRLLPSFPQKIAWMEAFHHPPKSREGTLFGSNFVFFGFQQSFHFFPFFEGGWGPKLWSVFSAQRPWS